MERIRQLRKERGLSQARLAVMADMDPATLNRLERGTGNPNLKTLERVATALDVEVADLLGKAPASSQPSFNGLLEEERRADTTAAEIISGYEDIARRYRLAWRDALQSIAEPWDERLRTGAFDKSAVEQFFSDVAAISASVSGALAANMDEDRLRWQHRGLPSAEEDWRGVWDSAISRAGARLLEVSERVWDAAAQRFTQSELQTARRKRDEAQRALGRAA